MRPENHPRYQPNVLQASHLQLKTKSESKQMTQHWVSSKGVNPVSGHFLESRVSNIHPTVPIKTTIHPVKPIKPGITMGKPVSLEEYEYHKKESMVRSPSKTQKCDLSQTHIDHEVENVQQTHHL
jgi:hypothetical protein